MYVTDDDDVVSGCGGVFSQPLPRNGSYAYLRTANDASSRSERRSIAQSTCEAVNRGWYRHESDQVELKAADAAETSTTVVSPSCGVWPNLSPRAADASTEVRRAEGTVLSVALQLVKESREVAAVSAASAYQVGGGFAGGGRHALEEAVCVQSTLYRCLRHAWRQTGVAKGVAYIPHDGAVLTPRVEVFREGTAEGYAFLPAPVELTCVVSVAMPNLNSRVRDAPLEKFGSSDAHRSAIACRWRAVLRAAISAGASDIVCPDAGCGVYGNDPTTVGTALGEVLRTDYWGLIKTLWLVGSEAFCSAVDAGIAAGAKTQQEPINRELSWNAATFASLKGKLLERIPSLSGKAGSTRSGASTPTHSESSRRKSRSLALKGAAQKEEVHEDVSHNSTVGNIDIEAQRVTQALDQKTDFQSNQSQSSTSRAPWSPGPKPTKKLLKCLSSHMSTSASSKDSLEGEGNEDTRDLVDATPPVSKSNASLTDELLRQHLQTLLLRDGTIPEASDIIIETNSGQSICPGHLMHQDAVMVSGLANWDGVDSTVSEVVMLNIKAAELRTEFERLSLSSDTVVVSM